MPIDVQWQDENGLVLAQYDGPAIDVAFLEAASPHTRCLAFVDPYGDALFNAAQVEVLAQELARRSARNVRRRLDHPISSETALPGMRRADVRPTHFSALTINHVRH